MNRVSTWLKHLLWFFVATGCGAVFAAGGTTPAVTANVLGTCKCSAANTRLAFGTIDPSSLVNAKAPVEFPERGAAGQVP